MAGAGVIGLLSAFSTYSVKFATVVGEKGELQLGFGAAADQLPGSLGMAVVNIALVLAATMIWQRYLQRRTA